jgi:tetratricopeptide (TPR) repeat protein
MSKPPCTFTPAPPATSFLRTPDEDLPVLLKALAGARQQRLRSSEAHLLIRIGAAHLDQGDPQSGITHLELGLRLLDGADDPEWAIFALHEIAVTHHRASAWGAAAAAYEGLLDRLFVQYGPPPWSASDQDFVLCIAMAASDMCLAAADRQRAARLHRRIAPLLEGWAAVPDLVRRHRRPFERWREGRAVFHLWPLVERVVEDAAEGGPSELETRLRQVLIRVLYGADEYEKAAGHAQVLLSRARARGDREMCARMLHWIGYCLYRTEEKAETLRHLEEALQLLPFVGPPAVQIDLLITVGACGEGAKLGQGIRRLTQAVEMARQHGEVELLANALWLLGRAYYWGGDMARALPLLQESLEQARAAGSTMEEMGALVWQAHVHEFMGDHALARRLRGRVKQLYLEHCAELDGEIRFAPPPREIWESGVQA